MGELHGFCFDYALGLKKNGGTTASARGRMASSIATSTLDEFTHKLSEGLGKVSAKFVRDFVTGVHQCRSVNLTDVARSLHEDIELHATHKRLSRNLARSELTTHIADRLLEMGAAKVGPDTRLIVHTYDLNKRYAQRMEYLHGSGPDQGTGRGYHVCEIVASEPGSQDYVPLLTTLWSRHAPGYESDLDEITRAVRRVLKATDGRGILHMNEFLVSAEVLRGMVRDPELRFIAQVSRADHQLVYRRQTRDIGDLMADCPTPYGKTMFKLYPGDDSHPAIERSVFVHFGLMPVNLPDSERPLSLIVIKSNGWNGAANPEIPVVTTECGLRSREALTDLVTAYSSTLDVAQAHQQHKLGYNLADFRVLTYERLQLLMTLLQAVVFYDADLAHSTGLKMWMVSLRPHPGNHARDFLAPREFVATSTTE